MSGDDVLFICGSDEYGTPISITADRNGVPPKEIADRYHAEHERSFKSMNIEFDIFSRTTYPEHTELVHDIFLKLHRGGFFDERTMVSPYCKTCRRFLPDRYVEGICPYCGYEKARGDQCDHCGKTLDPAELKSPRCVISGDEPEFRETKHLFFRLSQFSTKLGEYISKKDWWRQNVRAFSLSYIGEGLKDRPVTRDLEWGVTVPLPGYENKRIYVWFEALMGYVSASIILSRRRGDNELWRRYWSDPETRSYYFLGKDNIIFHSVIWPAILMGDGRFILPYDIPANENLRMNGQYFSKSRGIGISVDDALSLVPAEYLRYYVASILPDTGDSDFSLADLQDKVNSELISKYGNYINRLTSFISSNNLEIPSKPGSGFSESIEYASEFLNEYRKLMDAIEIKKAIRRWVDFVQAGNSMFNRLQPWKTVKEDREKCASDLFLLTCISGIMTITLSPFLPASSERIWKTLGSRETMTMITASKIVEGKVHFRPAHEKIPFEPLLIDLRGPNSLDLVVAKVLDAREHPDADRLLILKVSLGSEERQIVAGLRKFYAPSDLKGRRIIIVANLKKSKIRGEESNGMLLAADDGTRSMILQPSGKAPEGTRVTIGQYHYNGTGTIEISDMSKYSLRVGLYGSGKAATAAIDGNSEILYAGDEPVVPDGDLPVGSSIH